MGGLLMVWAECVCVCECEVLQGDDKVNKAIVRG